MLIFLSVCIFVCALLEFFVIDVCKILEITYFVVFTEELEKFISFILCRNDILNDILIGKKKLVNHTTLSS